MTAPFHVRSQFLPFAKPDIGEEEVESVSEVIRSGWLTTGPKVRQFEALFSEYVGSKHAIAVNSATAALHIALEAGGIEAGDEVITSTFTFAATAEVIHYLKAKPVLADIDCHTLNIDTDKLDALLTKKTKAIIPVHVAGVSANLDNIRAFAQKHNLLVVEDAAHALPTQYKGQMIGGLSDFTAFSFYVTKTLATGEGGMLTTNNDTWAERCRIMSLHGISKDAWKRYTSDGSWYYEILAPGFKYNMTDVAAAMGIVQLGKVEKMTTRRIEIAHKYNEAFQPHPALQIAPHFPDSTHPYHLYILRLNLAALSIDRSAFIAQLHKSNIGVSVHWMPLHMHPYYRQTYGYQPQDLPNAYQEYQRVISLPIYSTMTDADVDDVITIIKQIADHYLV